MGRPKSKNVTEKLMIQLTLPKGGKEKLRRAAANDDLPLATWLRRVVMRAIESQK